MHPAAHSTKSNYCTVVKLDWESPQEARFVDKKIRSYKIV